MTAATLTMPRLGETMEEGEIVRWLVAEGAAYRRGDAILEIETDKTVAEIPALCDGRLLRIIAPEGARVAVGEPIAEVTGALETAGAPPVGPDAAAVAAPAATASTAPVPGVATAGGSPDTRLRATPEARRMARNAGLSLAALAGTGRRGRIEKRDVEAALSTPLGPRFAQTSYGPIAFDAVGTGGQTFLLIHGFAGDRSAWAVLASGLSRAGHRVITPDLPAHGATGAEAATPEDLIAPMLDFASGLSGPVHLVGHSLGAVVAVAVAARLGDRARGLTLIAPVGAGREINAGFVRGMAGATAPGEIAQLMAMLGPKAGALSDQMLGVMAAQSARGRLRALADALVGPQGQKVDILHPLELLPAALPVRALIGTGDQIVPAAQAMNLPPRVGVHFLATGHMPQWDLPGQTLDLVMRGAGE